MAELRHLDITCDIYRAEESANEILAVIKPHWKLTTVRFVRFTEGLYNVMIGCYQEEDIDKDEMVLIRVFGANTEIIVDRQAEKNAMLFLSQQEFSPPIYCTFNNGMVYGYVKGSTLDQEMVRDNNIRCLIAKEMARMHSLKKMGEHSTENSNALPDLGTKLLRYLTLIPEQFSDKDNQELFLCEVGNKRPLHAECSLLIQYLNTLTCDVVLCHNDLLLNNIVFDKHQQKVSFIDYEFTFYNFQAFDIGNHFANYAGVAVERDSSKYPDKEYQLSWIRVYLEEYYSLTGRIGAPTDEDVEKLYIDVCLCSLTATFFWALCAMVCAEFTPGGFDWLWYAIIRLKEYYRQKDVVLSMKYKGKRRTPAEGCGNTSSSSK